MAWIKETIKDEKRKHALMPFGKEKRDSDWAESAEKKIIKAMQKYIHKNNTIPMKDLHNLECECGHSLFEHVDFDLMKKTGKGCKNKFCICVKFKPKKMNPNLRLATTDGGWVNAIELKTFLEGIK